MFSTRNLEAASRRAALVMTVAVIGIAGSSFAASAQQATNQAQAPEAAPAAQSAPATVRQALTEVVQQDAADVAQSADAAPSEAARAPAASAAPVIKHGQRRFSHSLPAHPTFKAPSYGHQQAYDPAPYRSHRHVVHPQHFGYRHVQHGYALRGHGHGGHGHGYRVSNGYNSFGRH